jgi:hypothetical protein
MIIAGLIIAAPKSKKMRTNFETGRQQLYGARGEGPLVERKWKKLRNEWKAGSSVPASTGIPADPPVRRHHLTVLVRWPQL